jgi:uncharacterized protein
MMTESDMPPCLIYIDKEGRWYHEGAEMIHREFIRLFYDNMELDSRGRYVIDWKGQRCYVEVEDTAFVVRRVVRQEKGDENGNERLILSLSDDTQEELMPDTLYVGRDNVLYCSVKDRVFPARFTRAAYYQLAEYVEEENGTYYLPLNGLRNKISQCDPS